MATSSPAAAPSVVATAAATPPAGRATRWLVPAALLAVIVVALPMTARMLHSGPPSDVGTLKPTVNGVYRVLLAPERTPVAIGPVHRWTVRVDAVASGAAGTAPVTVSVDGGMPQHGHGLPTQPRVTGRLADGRLVIDGMKFSMPGWWELRLRVAGPAGTDSVTYNLTL